MASQQAGFWLNYETHQWFKIIEHEQDLRLDPEKFGVDPNVLTKFVPIEQRDEFLLYILKTYPLCRIRQYALHTSAEFISETGVENILWDLYNCIEENWLCGDYSGLSINNIGRDSVYLNWSEFKTKLKEDDFIIKESNGNLLSIFPEQAKKFEWKDGTKRKFDILFENITKNL